MGINRAPFNALVDDDGSGNIGTPWNKTQIQNVLLDPIDALGFSGWNTFQTTLRADNGAWSSPNPWMRYKKLDKTVLLIIAIDNGVLTLSPRYLYASLPFPCMGTGSIMATNYAWMYHPSSGMIHAYLEANAGATELTIQKFDLNQIPAAASGGFYIRGQFHYETP